MNKEVATIADKTALIEVMGNSLYVGAKPESIEMVLAYCEAAHLDPMQKPVHIVPMNTKNPVTGNYEWRDVIMPGIGHYRIQADRSGTMAGVSKPEFGPDMIVTLTDKNGKHIEVNYPEWCQVIVKKVVGNHICEFVGYEYWSENYATDSRNSTAPNAMWRKRPRGQLAKCAEAQALRKAFPEIGAQPTAEEMEGKVIDMGAAEVVTEIDDTPPVYPDADFDKNLPKWRDIIEAGKKTADQIIAMVKTKGSLTGEQINKIKGESQEEAA